MTKKYTCLAKFAVKNFCGAQYNNGGLNKHAVSSQTNDLAYQVQADIDEGPVVIAAFNEASLGESIKDGLNLGRVFDVVRVVVHDLGNVRHHLGVNVEKLFTRVINSVQ